MANHFPVSQDAQVSGVIYAVSFLSNMPVAGNSSWVLESSRDAASAFAVSYQFATTWTAGVLSVNVEGFDQDMAEAAITALLNQARATFGVPVATWQASIAVSRQWLFTQNTQGSAMATAFSDAMAYTAA